MRGLVACGVIAAGCGRIGFGDDATPTCQEAGVDEPCLQLVIESATWDQARVACAAIPDMHLATIRAPGENERVAELAAMVPFDPATQPSTNQRQRMWVGGNAPVDIADWAWVTG